MDNTSLILLSVSIIAAISTYYVNGDLKQGPIKSSALLSLVVALFFYFFPHIMSPILTTKIPVVFFGASFAGMSSKEVIHQYWWMALAGSIFGLIFLHTSKFFTGYGGGLGTTALLSIVITFALIQLWQLAIKRS